MTFGMCVALASMLYLGGATLFSYKPAPRRPCTAVTPFEHGLVDRPLRDLHPVMAAE